MRANPSYSASEQTCCIHSSIWRATIQQISFSQINFYLTFSVITAPTESMKSPYEKSNTKHQMLEKLQCNKNCIKRIADAPPFFYTIHSSIHTSCLRILQPLAQGEEDALQSKPMRQHAAYKMVPKITSLAMHLKNKNKSIE